MLYDPLKYGLNYSQKDNMLPVCTHAHTYAAELLDTERLEDRTVTISSGPKI